MSALLPRGPFRQDRADRPIKFIESLRLGADPYTGQPFRLFDVQRQFVTELFGRMHPDDASRRQYASAYYSTGRGHGKTGLMAALGLTGLCGMGVQGGEIVSAAASKDQASLIYDEIHRIAQHTPHLVDRLHFTPHKRMVIDTKSGTTFRALAADGDTAMGLKPYPLILLDELHVWKGRAGHNLFNALKTAQAKRGALMVVGTTAGMVDRTSVWWDVYQYACKVRDGVVDDPSFLSCIHETPMDADIEDRSMWRLANPSDLVSMDALETTYREAQGSPARLSAFRAYHLNQPVEQMGDAWLDMSRWAQCPTYADDELLDATGQPLPSYAGLDAAWRTDYTALVVVTPLPDGRHAVRCRFWLPTNAKSTTHHRPYESWVASDALTLTPGEVVDWLRIEDDVADLCVRWNVKQLAYDPAKMDIFRQQLEKRLPSAGTQGVTVLIAQRQNALHTGLRAIEDGVKGGTLSHNGQPVLQWMASNAIVLSGRRDEYMLAKPTGAQAIDGMAALSMAMQRALLASAAPEPIPAPRPSILLL